MCISSKISERQNNIATQFMSLMCFTSGELICVRKSTVLSNSIGGNNLHLFHQTPVATCHCPCAIFANNQSILIPSSLHNTIWLGTLPVRSMCTRYPLAIVGFPHKVSQKKRCWVQEKIGDFLFDLDTKITLLGLGIDRG